MGGLVLVGVIPEHPPQTQSLFPSTFADMLC